ncbi:hypothetical protein D3C78_1663630 [compost metagenome]
MNERKSLYQVIEEVYPVRVNERDYDSIEKDVSYYLLQGFTISECVQAAIDFYDENKHWCDDDPAACFNYGMHEYLSH